MNFKKFDSATDLNMWLSNVYMRDLLDKFDLNKVSSDSPLAYYTNSFSGQINYALRKDILSGTRFRYEDLQIELVKCNVPENIVAYRFVDLKELLIWWFNTLFFKKYINPMFVSTTLLPSCFNGQARTQSFVIKILIPKYACGMYITDLLDVPVSEYEFLIPHHSQFVRRGLFTFELIP